MVPYFFITVSATLGFHCSRDILECWYCSKEWLLPSIRPKEMSNCFAHFSLKTGMLNLSQGLGGFSSHWFQQQTDMGLHWSVYPKLRLLLYFRGVWNTKKDLQIQSMTFSVNVILRFPYVCSTNFWTYRTSVFLVWFWNILAWFSG